MFITGRKVNNFLFILQIKKIISVQMMLHNIKIRLFFFIIKRIEFSEHHFISPINKAKQEIFNVISPRKILLQKKFYFFRDESP
jgi:hypothetical protein